MGMGRKPIQVCLNTLDYVKELPASRHKGDCGIIATSILTRLPYGTAANWLISEGIYCPDRGSSSGGKLMDWLRDEFAPKSRVRWHGEVSLYQYLKARGDWTGWIIHDVPGGGIAHVIAVKKGMVFDTLNISPDRLKVLGTLTQSY